MVDRAFIRKYFGFSFIFTGICLFLGLIVAVNDGYAADHPGFGSMVFHIFEILFILLILSILEISLSFDNAVVNASILKTMTPFWRRMFLTWGILIAVFGMRLVFPIIIVMLAAEIPNPWDAIVLAAQEPNEYQRIMEDAHVGVAAFGGGFLIMVALKFFFDQDKEVHWIGAIERRLIHFAALPAIEIAIALGLLAYISTFMAVYLPPVGSPISPSDLSPEALSLLFPRETFLADTPFTLQHINIIESQRALLEEFMLRQDRDTMLFAGVCGILTFLVVEAFGRWLEEREKALAAAGQAGLGAFLYLEVLDASFSFDGVIGAFALSNNLFVIALGLGIGAIYVRSMTIMLVETGTLAQFRYLENGAFWAILALAIIMFAQSVHVHIPEVVTGLIGLVLIGASFWSSIKANRRDRAAGIEPGAAATEEGGTVATSEANDAEARLQARFAALEARLTERLEARLAGGLGPDLAKPAE